MNTSETNSTLGFSYVKNASCCCCFHHQIHSNLRATLDMHGAHFRHHPAHSLQRGVVVTDLHAAAHEVLLLEDDHAAALVGLWAAERQPSARY